MSKSKCKICPYSQKLAQYFDTTPRYANAIYSNYSAKTGEKLVYGMSEEDIKAFFDRIAEFRKKNAAEALKGERSLFRKSFGSNEVFNYNEVFSKFNLNVLEDILDEFVGLTITQLEALQSEGQSKEDALKAVGITNIFKTIGNRYAQLFKTLTPKIANVKSQLATVGKKISDFNTNGVNSNNQAEFENVVKDYNILTSEYNSLIKKASIIRDLIDSKSGIFFSVAAMSIPTLNKILGVKINNDFTLDDEDLIEHFSDELESIDDEESIYEHWMQKLDHEDPTGALSALVKRELMTLPRQKVVVKASYKPKYENGQPVYTRDTEGKLLRDSNGNPIPELEYSAETELTTLKTTIFGIDKISNPDIEARRLLSILKDCNSETQMMEVLSKLERYKNLYSKLKDNPRLKTTFRSAFDKYFQEYEAVDTRIDAVTSIADSFAMPLNTENKDNIVRSFFLNMLYKQKPGPNSFFVVDSKVDQNGRNYNELRPNFQKFIAYRDRMKAIFETDKNGVSEFNSTTDIDKKSAYLAQLFDGLGMNYSIEGLNTLLFNTIDLQAAIDAVSVITNRDTEALFNPQSRVNTRLSTQGGTEETRETKRIDLKILSNANVSKAFSTLLKLSNPSTISSKFTAMFDYAGSTMSSYIMPSPYINFIKSIRSLSASTVDENGNPRVSPLQEYLDNKYLDSPQYVQTKTVGDKQEKNILNRWLSDIYNCTNDTKTSKSIKDKFGIIRAIGIDNVNFEDIPDREHMLMFLAMYFSHRSSLNIRYVDTVPSTKDMESDVHYYLNGSPKGYTKAGEEYRTDYAYIPSFITGDTNALRCIRTLHYGESEIFKGMYNLYLADLQDQNLQQFMEDNGFTVYANGKETYTKNHKFGILDFLNQPKYKQLLESAQKRYNSDVIPEFEFIEIVKEYLGNGKEIIGDGFKLFKEQLNNLGILETVKVIEEEDGNTITYNKYKYLDSFLKGNEENKEQKLDEILRDFYINYKFGLYNQAHIMQVNPNFFDGVEDYQKRNKGTLTNGLRISPEAKIGEESLFDTNDFAQEVGYFYDISAEMIAEDMEMIRNNMRKYGNLSEAEIESRLAPYKSNTLTDGQAYRIFESYRKILGGVNLQYWTNKQEEAYQRIEEIIKPVKQGLKDELTIEEIKEIEDLQVVFMPIKPINDTIETFSKNSYKIAVQFKYAEVPIIPEMYPKNSLMRQLGTMMRNKHFDLLCSDKCLKKGAFGQIELQFVTKNDDGIPKYIAGRTFTYIDGTGKTITINKGDVIPAIDSRGNFIDTTEDYDPKKVNMSSQRRFRANFMEEGNDEIFYNYRQYDSDRAADAGRILEETGETIEVKKTTIEDILNNQSEFVEGTSQLGNWVRHHSPLDNYLIQLNKPYHVSHDVIHGTQERKIVGGNIILDEDYIIPGFNGGNPIKGNVVQQIYNMLNSAKFVQSYQDFLETINNPYSLTRRLAYSALNSGRVNPSIMQRIALEGDNPVIPYSEVSNVHDLASTLISILKKDVIRQTISGGTIVQASALATGVDYVDDPDLHLIKDAAGNPVSMEIEVPFDFVVKSGKSDINLKFEEYCHADGSFIMDGNTTKIEKEFPGILDVLLYRIPSEKEYSIFVAKIKRCTPRTVASTIKMPIECTTIADFDFDIDTLNIIRHAYKLDNMKVDNKELWDSFYESHPEWAKALETAKVESASDPSVDKALIDKYNIPNNKLDENGRPPKHYYWELAKAYSPFGVLMSDKQQVMSDYMAELVSKVKAESSHLFDFNFEGLTDADVLKLIDGTYDKYDLDNMILDLSIAIMSHPKVWTSHMTKGGFDNTIRAAKYMQLLENGEIKFQQDGESSYDVSFITDEYIDSLPNPKEKFDYSEPMTSINFKQKNQIAGTLIGIFANENINLYLSQYMKTFSISANSKPILFGSLLDSAIVDGKDLKGDPRIGRNFLFKEVNGKSIKQELAELLSSAVDAVKKPTLDKLNLNIITADAAAMLVRLGYTKTDIGLLFNQPIIKDMCLYMNRHPEETNVTTVLKKLCLQAGLGDLGQVLYADSDTSKLTLGKLTYAKVNHTYDSTQLEVAKLFNRIITYKQDFSDFIQQTRNTSANIVKSKFENFITRKHKTSRSQFSSLDIETYEGAEKAFPVNLTKFDINDGTVESLLQLMMSNLNNPFAYEDVVYNLTDKGMTLLMDKFTMYNTNLYNTCRNALAEFMAPWGIAQEEMEAFHDFIPYARLVAANGDFNPTAVNPDVNLNPEGLTNAELYLRGIIDTLQEIISDKSFDAKNNALLSAINLVPAVTLKEKSGRSKRAVTSDAKDVAITFSYSFSSTSFEQMAITKAWQDLYDRGGEFRKFAVMLYMHGYYTRGLNSGLNQFLHFAPIDVINAVKFNYDTNSPYTDVYNTDLATTTDEMQAKRLAYDFMVQNAGNPRVAKVMPFSYEQVKDSIDENKIIVGKSDSVITSNLLSECVLSTKREKGKVIGKYYRPFINVDGKIYVLDGFSESLNNYYPSDTVLNSLTYVLLESTPINDYREFFNSGNNFIFGEADSSVSSIITKLNTDAISADVPESTNNTKSAVQIAEQKEKEGSSEVIGEDGILVC